MPDQATATITDPPDSTDDGFDIGEVEALYDTPTDQQPVVDDTPPADEPEPTPEPGAEPAPKAKLDLNAELSEPIAGKYKTLGDVVKAIEAQASLIGKQGTELEKAKEATALLELIKTDPAKAKDEIDRMSMTPEERNLDMAIRLNADPSTVIGETVEEKLNHILAVREANQQYETSLRKVYPSWDAMTETRKQAKVELDSGVMGEPEMLHLIALGRSVRDGKLGLSGDKPDTTPLLDPAGGASAVPRSPSKPGPSVSAEDQLINDLDALDIPTL